MGMRIHNTFTEILEIFDVKGIFCYKEISPKIKLHITLLRYIGMLVVRNKEYIMWSRPLLARIFKTVVMDFASTLEILNTPVIENYRDD